MGVNREALQLHTVYKRSHFLLQVTRESVSGTASHVCVSEHGMKLKVCMIKSLSPQEKYQLLPLVLLLVLHARNNTDSNKLVIFSFGFNRCINISYTVEPL